MSAARPGRRSFVMDDPGDLSAEPGSLPWALAMKLQILVAFHERDSVANHLQVMRDGFKQHEGWRVLLDAKGRPFPSWEAFCRAPSPYGLGTTADHLDAEVEQRALRDKRGRPTKAEQDKGVRNTFTRGSTNAAYLLARLERDSKLKPALRPLVARVRAGELKPKTAARLAGIIKDKTPLEQLQRLWQKTAPKDRTTFLRWVNKYAV